MEALMTATATHEESTTDLVAHASRQLAQLVGEEVRLAQLEVSVKGKKAGISAGLLASSSILAIYAVGCLIAAGVLGLSTVVDGWLAALIFGGGLPLLAGLGALGGRRAAQQGLSPVPTQAPEEIRADVNAIKEGLHR
jgi:hypothetical protein